MAADDWFGGLDLGIKYAIVLGCLIGAVLILGFTKLFLIRQKTRRLQAEAKAKAADEEGKVEQIALNQREEDEGDLFGVRALERGFTGGVAQSRPTTPGPGSSFSRSTLALSSHIPFGQPAANRSTNASSTITIDAGGGSSPPKQPSPVAQLSGRLSPHHARVQDVAVDMGLNVPDSPRLPRSPESSRAPSPLSMSQTSPQLHPITIPPPGLDFSYNGEESVSPRQQAKGPTQVTTAARGEAVASESASIVSQTDTVSPPESVDGRESPDSRFQTPRHSTYNFSIRVEEPSSPEPIHNPHGDPNINTSRLSTQNGTGNGVRASTQSLTDVYDSYYNNRLSNVRNGPNQLATPVEVQSPEEEVVDRRRYSRGPSRI